MTTATPSPFASGGKVWKIPSADDITAPKKNKHQNIAQQVTVAIFSLALVFIMVCIGLLAPGLMLDVSSIVPQANPSGGNDADSGYMADYNAFLIFQEPASLGFLLLAFIAMHIMLLLFVRYKPKNAIKAVIAIVGSMLALFAVSCSLHITEQSSETLTLQSWMSERYGFTPTEGSNTTRLPNEGHLYKDETTGVIAETKKIGNGYYLYDAITGVELTLKKNGEK